MLITGLHTVCDCYCITCNSVLGWKYEVAYEESQKYKEGKFILEKVMCGCGCNVMGMLSRTHKDRTVWQQLGAML